MDASDFVDALDRNTEKRWKKLFSNQPYIEDEKERTNFLLDNVQFYKIELRRSPRKHFFSCLLLENLI